MILWFLFCSRTLFFKKTQMDAFVGKKIVGVPFKSGPKWVMVFPNVDADIYYKAAKEETKVGKGWMLVKPLSWSAFPTLKKHGGAHVTLTEKPNLPMNDCLVTFTIQGHDQILEPEYESGLTGDVTKGFVILLLKPDVKELPFDPPCHVSIAQFIKN
jgi:hypothetical protein